MNFVVEEQRRGRSLTLNFSIIYKAGNNEEITGEYGMDDFAEVRFKFKSNTFNGRIEIFLSLRKQPITQKSVVTLDINCKVLNYSKQWTCTEHWIEWQQMTKDVYWDTADDKHYLKVIPINITVNETKLITAESIYQDSDWTDFIMSASDGSISAHRACLAAHSDVFKTMLSQEWRETNEGRLKIEGVSLQTLQHLKQYMYLGTLPEAGVDALLPLLQLSMCYLIDNLKSACIFKLARMVTSETLDDVLAFAIENKIPELVSAILQVTPDSIVHGAYEKKKRDQNLKKTEAEKE